MELILEIIIYLLVVLGLITVCFTFFNKFNLIEQVIDNNKESFKDEKATYIREKEENEKIKINVRYKNIASDKLKEIKEALELGLYNQITDVVDEINYIDSSKK